MSHARTIAAVDAYLYERETELIDFLADLVRIDSQIPPYADERRIIQCLQSRMVGLGLDSGHILAADPRRPNLVTRLRGTGGGLALLLNGHVDTKPVGDSTALWHSDPLQPDVRDGRMYGLGTSDMKAAVAAMVFAAAALRHSGTDLAGDLVLAFVADEEAGAVFGSKVVAPQLTDVDACVLGEPSGWEHDWQGLHIVSRGICCFRVRVHGTQMHSSLSDRLESVNASSRMAQLMVSAENDLEFEVPLGSGDVSWTLNVGVIVSGGVYFGVLPGEAEFACDLRTVPGMSERSVRQTLERWLHSMCEADERLDADIVFEPDLGWIPAAEISAEHAVVGAIRTAADEVLGSTPPLSVFPGTTDAPWFQQAGIPTVPSWGPGVLACCHGPNEYVELESVLQAARMYARIAARYCDLPPA